MEFECAAGSPRMRVSATISSLARLRPPESLLPLRVEADRRPGRDHSRQEIGAIRSGR